MTRTLILVLLCLGLCGCETLPSYQLRQSYVDTHKVISPKVKEAILRGEVFVGMTKDEVKASWGAGSGQATNGGDFFINSKECYAGGCFEHVNLQGWHLIFLNDKLESMSQ